ncbi:MAG TPA: glycosyltransferase family 2 protein [Gammaproteobacteria bacterium]|nr:glycosyltransferase family 2 protein [Gammaproteobacteria bacterium]
MSSGGVEAIIVSFNSGCSLIRCCEALLQEERVERIRVIDNTPDGADSMLFKSGDFRDGRIAVTATGRNLGFGPAVNSALKEVAAPYVAIVNPDGVVETGAVARLVQVLEHEPQAVLAGARLLGQDGREQQGSRRREPTPGRLIANTLVRALRLRRWYEFGFEMKDAPLPAEPVEVGAVSGACMVGRTPGLRAIGGFDEHFFLHFEDLDLCKRLRDAGGTILYVPDAVFHHVGGGSSASRPYFVIWHKHVSMIRYYFKHHRRLGAGCAWLPLICLMAVLRCGALMGRRLISGRL